MKKAFCFLYILAILCCGICGCAKDETATIEVPAFESETAFFQLVQNGLWQCGSNTEKTLKYCVFSEDQCTVIMISSDLKGALTDIIISMTEKGLATEYDDVYQLLAAVPESGFVRDVYSVAYDFKKGIVESSDGNMIWDFSDEFVMRHEGEAYYPEDTLPTLTLAYAEAKVNVEQYFCNQFLKKYEAAAAADDVRYDPYGYLGTTFLVTGTAELDDYYNYEYRGMEMVYFAIRLSVNGNYSDDWMLYARRDTHNDLLEILKERGTVKLTAASNTVFVNAAANRMATLKDYYVAGQWKIEKTETVLKAEFTNEGAATPAYVQSESLYLQYIAFFANTDITDVSFHTLTVGDDTYTPAEGLYTAEKLTAGEELVVGVEFAGPASVYGISFLDDSGKPRRYALYMSGENNSAVLEEYTP